MLKCLETLGLFFGEIVKKNANLGIKLIDVIRVAPH